MKEQMWTKVEVKKLSRKEAEEKIKKYQEDIKKRQEEQKNEASN